MTNKQHGHEQLQIYINEFDTNRLIHQYHQLL